MTIEARSSMFARRALAYTLVCAALAGSSACGDDESTSDSSKPDAKDAAVDPRDERDASGGSMSTPMRDAMASPAGSGSGASGSSGGDAGGLGMLPEGCETPAPNTAPELLSCTGLYADIEAKEVASDVRAFAPAIALWSDGADKARWIYLPPDTQIDSTVSEDWKFPIGTKLFKEFSHKGHRVETRLFWKLTDTFWVRTAYRWNAEETEATRFAGGDVEVEGDTYHIPTAKECDQCHKGRDDRALGFEPALLGLPGATGLTLAQLKDESLLTDDSIVNTFTIGDDGTNKAAPALGWLHVNCGVSCHNDNTSSEGYSSRLRLRLQAEELDGRPSTDFEARETGIDIEARTPRWRGQTRIIPGVPAQSLLYILASTRNPDQPKDQMPPIASRLVDEPGVALVADWIRAMAPGNDEDAGD